MYVCNDGSVMFDKGERNISMISLREIRYHTRAYGYKYIRHCKHFENSHQNLLTSCQIIRGVDNMYLHKQKLPAVITTTRISYYIMGNFIKSKII